MPQSYIFYYYYLTCVCLCVWNEFRSLYSILLLFSHTRFWVHEEVRCSWTVGGWLTGGAVKSFEEVCLKRCFSFCCFPKKMSECLEETTGSYRRIMGSTESDPGELSLKSSTSNEPDVTPELEQWVPLDLLIYLEKYNQRRHSDLIKKKLFRPFSNPPDISEMQQPLKNAFCAKRI